MSWSYGTIADEERAACSAQLETAEENLKSYFQERLDIDARARNTTGLAVLLSPMADPTWYELGTGQQEADEAVTGVMNGPWASTALFRERPNREYLGLAGLHLLHQDRRGPHNLAAMALRDYALNLRRGPVLRGFVLLVHVVGPNDAAPGSELFRYEDISKYDKGFPSDFTKYVRTAKDYWPAQEA